MRQLVVSTFMSLDGVMQAPGGPEEDPAGGFEHGGWSVPHWDEVMMGWMGESMGKPFDLVLGRKTYEIFAAHWPHVDEPGAAELNAATKHVASRTVDRLDWQNSQLLEGDVPDAVRRLKQQDGPELQVHGSSNLLQTLQGDDLVDEYRLMIFPVVLGFGKRLFEEGVTPVGLGLAESRISSTGVLIARYRRAGEVGHGTFAREEPTPQEVERRARLEE
jgi:dihydrofolate reductase